MHIDHDRRNSLMNYKKNPIKLKSPHAKNTI